MGPHPRYLGPEVPAEQRLWQDPVPAVDHKLIESSFGDRTLLVEFLEGPHGVTVRETFDPEAIHPVEFQRQGWQGILDRFARHAEGK